MMKLKAYYSNPGNDFDEALARLRRILFTNF